MGFSKIESAITSQIATLFQKRGEVEPSAIIKALEREVVKSQKKVGNEILVPNDYVIYLSEEDCHRLSAARVIKALHETVERKVIKENCHMEGKLTVRMEKMIEEDEVIEIKSKFIDDKSSTEDTINLENEKYSTDMVTQTTMVDEDDKTLIAETTNYKNVKKLTYPKMNDYEIAKLKLKLYENEIEYVLGERQFYIGRKESNDLVLNDESVSRIHAFISYDRHRHILQDTNSLNGTYINKNLIIKQELKHSDKILIGNVQVVYEVI